MDSKPVHPTRRGGSVLHPVNLAATRARLYALRHLPRSTALGRVTIEEERRLAEELLALPDETDALVWLRQERSAEVAHHALREALRSYRVINRGPVSPLIGAAAEFESGTGVGGIALVQALRQAQARPPWTLTPSIPGASTDDIHELFGELLLVREPIDPLLWLEGEPQVTLAAALTLRDLVGQLHPPAAWGDLSVLVDGVQALLTDGGPMEVMHHLRPDVTVTVSEGVSVTIAEIALRRAAVSVNACIELTPVDLPRAPGHLPLTSVTGFWDGFSQVEDDLGQRYLPTRVEPWYAHGRGSATGPVCTGLSIGTKVYYHPAIDPAARALSFRSPRSTVWLVGHLVPLEDVPMPPRIVGDVAWTSELPTRPGPA